MFKTHASYKIGNKEVVAVSLDGVYSVCYYENGGFVEAHDTDDELEAMNAYEWYCDKAFEIEYNKHH